MGFWRRLISHPGAVVGLVVILLYILAALLAPWIAPYGPREMVLADRLKPPAFVDGGTAAHLLGTDQLGQDIFTRILYGARVSLLVGLISVAISLTVGTVLGCVAGYWRGWVDRILSRVADLLMGFPYLLFTIFAMAVIGPGFGNLIIALCFKAWVEFFRLARGEMLTEGTKEYVEAARALGRGPVAIIAGEVLPNIIHSLLVLATLRMGYMIIMEASLSFLGLGIPPSIPAWGSMVNAGRDQMLNAWWVATMPGLAIVGLVLAINMFGEGLRDVLDPRMRR
ncbi:peptide/nickel transport system permease protein [Symbiobacterium terraclitae]|uniref:Peptide/nickel transport system permease protein n=1 Tax=Symbiobacterium terraclitae TaxID=557451 RepID=A0ABS4JNY6_9FIRM|nr:ABC transporter permease [Symbiobacterium terraclitae]MBP2017243.1 peptide/nickel transport system permease protein [Symbiobacterium terraclitae]